MKSHLFTLAAAIFAGSVHAQPTSQSSPSASQPERQAKTTKRLPDEATIDAERRRVDAERKALFDAGNPATNSARGAFPDVGAPTPSGVDIGAIANRYKGVAEARKAVDGLVVFASFSMPKTSLQRLIADTSRAGGVVVLRGFKDGSLKSTSIAMNELAGAAASAGVQINPDAFVKYRVKAVPAVALLRADADEKLDAEGCALPEAFALVSGDVQLVYALRELAKRAPNFREMADRYARPLQGATK